MRSPLTRLLIGLLLLSIPQMCCLAHICAMLQGFHKEQVVGSKFVFGMFLKGGAGSAVSSQFVKVRFVSVQFQPCLGCHFLSIVDTWCSDHMQGACHDVGVPALHTAPKWQGYNPRTTGFEAWSQVAGLVEGPSDPLC